DAPDPEELLADDALGFLLPGLQPRHPLPERARVMRPQAFGIPGLEALPGHFRQHARNVNQLAARENVLVDEFADPAAERRILQRVRGDAVVHDHPARLEQLVELAEVGPEVALADVLEHADARDLVERLCLVDVAIIHEPDLAATLEPELAYAIGGVRMLLIG